MTTLFMLLVGPLAVVINGMLVAFVASRWLDDFKANLVGFSATTGFFVGQSGRQLSGEVHQAEYMSAVVLGLALLWWFMFRRRSDVNARDLARGTDR